jgi:hypothetical protein
MDGTAAVGTGTTWARADHVHPSDTSRAPLASPAFTGTPTAPTPATADNSTAVATTAFVKAQPSGGAGITRIKPGGRLTLTSGSPVMSANVVGASSIYYSPYIHDGIPIFDGTSWVLQTFTEQTTALDTTNFLSGNNYDWFAFFTGGLVMMGYGPAWTNNTTRSAAISRLNGYWTNSASITLRWSNTGTQAVPAGQALYLGTIHATANGQTTMNFNPAAANGGSPNTVLGVFNAYNREPMISMSRDTGGAAFYWTYATKTWRRAHANANNSVSFMDGLGEVSCFASYQVWSSPIAGGSAGAMGISFNNTAAPLLVQGSWSANSLTAIGNFLPAMGFNAVNAMEIGDGGSGNNWYGSDLGLGFGQVQGLSVQVRI